MNASGWSAAYARRREAARAARRAMPLTPDEIDDRQVDAIAAAHATLDGWLDDGMAPATVDRLRAALPPRLPGGTRCDDAT